jgi:hypothetical protein
MRQLTELEISRLKILTENSVQFTLIEPTATALEKSIMDATGPVRDYLKSQNVHDYQQQEQGKENKILIQSQIVAADKLSSSNASLYRPDTKKGDPRIWFTGLKHFASSNDILGIIAFDGNLYVLNITRLDIEQLINSDNNNPIKEIVNEINNTSKAISDELLLLLKKIAAMGPVPAMLSADTAIGRTLETLLGISINSSKKPDYKGIELKSYRDARENRKNLFAQVPDWNLSKFKSSKDILDNYGYPRGADFKLYCTVSTLVTNSQGLILKLNPTVTELYENSAKHGDFLVWPLELLHKRLLEKHSETFWIGAESIVIEDKEHFQYKKVEHTKKPIVSQFDVLLGQGLITLDHLIKRTPSGGAKEKGPIFKINPNALSLLFPPSQKYDLV